MPDSSLAAERTIKGEVIYRERIALPPDAVLTVQLSDVSLADAPSTTVAKQQVNPAGQVPIHFELKFDGSAIQPRATYALQARITADDRLLFISDRRHEVDPLKTEHATMMLK
ncbi:MAG: YbaY family lipoprotein, partial [Microbacterium sp.]|nr:YbaY family lipoprotein [Microbacterium sp.]